MMDVTAQNCNYVIPFLQFIHQTMTTKIIGSTRNARCVLCNLHLQSQTASLPEQD